MSIRLMVLGVIDHKIEAHGYQVLQELTSWRASTWSKVRPGSIYHALSQMEKEGLLQNTGTKSSNTGPSKTTYRLTPKAREELVTLLRESLTAFDMETFSSGLAFMHLLRRSEVLELSRERLKAFEQNSELLHGLPMHSDTSNPSTNPALITTWATWVDATIEWEKNFIRELEAGEYRFAGE